jgi:mersacidin/lichenicidin family type 2 lantibiotic
MNNIVRAWKDEAYRQSLSAGEQAVLPANPIGEIELGDAELVAVYGTCSQNDDRINQIVAQQAVATFGNSVSGAVVSATAHNSYSAYNDKQQHVSSVQTCSIH